MNHIPVLRDESDRDADDDQPDPAPAVRGRRGHRGGARHNVSEIVSRLIFFDASTSLDDMSDGMRNWPTGRLLSTASRLVEHAWLDALTELGISHAGLIVLHLLESGPATQVELAGRARVEAQTMSRTVERLERAGLVERHPDAADRRRRMVVRTPAGAAVFVRAGRIEAELFPDVGDLPALRATLLGIIGSSGSARWSDGAPR